MKKYAALFLLLPLFLSCSDSGIRSNNPYLPNYSVLIDLNLNLPEYSKLKYVSNGVYITGKGIRGVIVFNTTGSGYNAFDAACPNQALAPCSTMIIQGIKALCPCDSEEYNLFTGLSDTGLQYPLKQYRVQVNGTMLRIYN